MQGVWLQHLKDEKEREAFKQVLKGSNLLKDRLLRILADKYDLIEKRGFREEDYAEAGWETLQAFRNGRLATLKEVADLFDFTEREA